jgi:hypothetical protein
MVPHFPAAGWIDFSSERWDRVRTDATVAYQCEHARGETLRIRSSRTPPPATGRLQLGYEQSLVSDWPSKYSRSFRCPAV